MTPFEAYKLFVALKNHFTSDSYDFVKYNGKTNVSEHSFEVRKDKYMFYKLSKHENPKLFLVANFAESPKLWIGDMFNLDQQMKYNEFLRRKQTLQYTFESDIDNLLENFDENFKVPNDGGYPHLLNLLVRKKITKETFIIIQDCVRFFANWNKQITDPVLWPQIARNSKKLYPFLEYEKDKYCGILRNKFS